MRNDDMEENHIDETSILCAILPLASSYIKIEIQHGLMRVIENCFLGLLQIDIDCYVTTHPDPKIESN
jgi:hypothetical protein